MKKKMNLRVLLVALILVYSIAFIGGILTNTNVKTEWYESIKPSLAPKGYVFLIVWNILFFLIGLSLYFSWICGIDKIKIILGYGINLFLNVFWSFLYFYLKKPNYALIDSLLLFSSSVYIFSINYKTNKKSSYLLIPYILWLLFAIILNYLSVFN